LQRNTADERFSTAPLQEVFYRSERPATVNSAAAPYHRSSTNIYYKKGYMAHAGIPPCKSSIFRSCQNRGFRGKVATDKLINLPVKVIQMVIWPLQPF
jgi:hypothetical protein